MTNPSPPLSAAPASSPPPKDMLVVGIGASAGGMQALTQFFEHMPARSGMAFVVVIHLSPDHESHAAAILQRCTRMPVQQVTQAVAIVPDQVYVIPPGQSLTIVDGGLRLQHAARVGGVNVAIDTFFRALAEARGAQAVAVVLSGSGTDGAVGLQRIKERGGVTMAQSPADALTDGMPAAAIATGTVDMVLPVAEMPERLLRLVQTAHAIELPQDSGPVADSDAPGTPAQALAAEAALKAVMALLRSRTRHDFRHYKRPTVLRRLERRMQVTGCTTLVDYHEHLLAHADETPALLQDMLISVTNFFRDRSAFDALERDVLPALVARVGSHRPLRAWVVGCASGEEAYSVAMLLQEAAEHAATSMQPFQVFATDIDDRALALARPGLYPGSIITDVAPTRLRNFFVPQNDHLRVVKPLRERVLFAHHNVLRDPPLSRVDLICCRNLLIYLDAVAQASVLESFRFALNSGGVLFLGGSETAESAPGQFSALDKKHRIYRVRGPAATERSAVPAPPPAAHTVPLPGGSVRPHARELRWADLHQRARSQHAAPSVLVDEQDRVLHLSDGLAPYLQLPEAQPPQFLLDCLAPGLQVALRAARYRRVRPGAPVDGTAPVSVESSTDAGLVRMTLLPVVDAPDGQDLQLVRFEKIADTLGPAAAEPIGTPAEPLLAQRDAEIARLQQQLQAVIEHGEASTEELMSSNEELQALNEELRSATEELETSREELQSTNEELTTVNAELALKVDETDRVNDDLKNLVNANDIATIFVDSLMCIKRFPPARHRAVQPDRLRHRAAAAAHHPPARLRRPARRRAACLRLAAAGRTRGARARWPAHHGASAALPQRRGQDRGRDPELRRREPAAPGPARRAQQCRAAAPGRRKHA